MKFKSSESLPIKICNELETEKCKGVLAWSSFEKRMFYWGYELENLAIKWKKIKKTLDNLRFLISILAGFSFLAFFVFLVWEKDLAMYIFEVDFWTKINFIASLFWLSAISFSYSVYKFLNLQREKVSIRKKSFKDKHKIKTKDFEKSLESAELFKKEKADEISKYFTDKSLKVLEDAYSEAEKTNAGAVNVYHIFYALLSDDLVSSLFTRLSIPIMAFKDGFETLYLKKEDKKDQKIKLGEDFFQIVFQACKSAYSSRQKYVRTTELFLSAYNHSEVLQEFLYNWGVGPDEVSNAVSWFNLREELKEKYAENRKASVFRSKHGIDRAMTAVATPYLNQYSKDITLIAKYGGLEQCVGRTDEVEQIFRILEGGEQNAILVGERGVGKRTIVNGIAEKMIENDVPGSLYEKRLVELSLSELMAGTTPSGAKERLVNIFREIGKARNIVLFIDDVDQLLGSRSEELGIEVANTLSEYLGEGSFLTIATSVPDGYKRYVVNSNIGSAFEKVDIGEMNENQAIRVCEYKIGFIEYKYDVYFSYEAIAKGVKLAKKLLFDKKMPDSAVELLTEVASYVKNKKKVKYVSKEDVEEVVSQKTGVPSGSVAENEKEKLLNFEGELHNRVVGQEEAVQAVSDALRRARSGMASGNRPIAVFLFLGPTGVGKTELAKSIADIYFGSEKAMIRMDMSEYEDSSGVYRLIGRPNEQGTGILTEAVKQKPFSLILLDELEKANKDILNLFLQVFDDGRLTDSSGKVIDFTNTIIISTSNAGTSFAQENLNNGVSLEEIREKMIRTKLKDYFTPEFINRFDGIVLFKPLAKEEIKQIAILMLKRVIKDLEDRGIELSIDDQALEELSEKGYDPEFGARPLRRVIQDNVENKLAKLLLKEELRRGDKLVLGAGLEFSKK